MKTPYVYQRRIKIFADGADLKSILAMAADPTIQGFTTNPTLMKQAGVTDYSQFCKNLLAEIKDKPISFEVFADDFEEMHRQALEIASFGKNVYVKIPITNSTGQSSIDLIRDLANQNVQLNVTAIFTLKQVEETCMAVRNGAPAIVSVFAGRIADAGIDPEPLMAQAADICESIAPKSELLWASSREALNVIQAERSGCRIITMTPDLIRKMSNFGKSLEQFSLETVQMFKRDAEAAGFQL
jgi:transaldolase